jgi:GNAT superfamily N-acetyltransferase
MQRMAVLPFRHALPDDWRLSQGMDTIAMSTSAIKATKIRKVRKANFHEDIAALISMTAFYIGEMKLTLDWDIEKRYFHLLQRKMMVQSGCSDMYLLEGRSQYPLAMAITTRTTVPNIRRLDAIMTFEQYRGHGLARRLLADIRNGKELHAYAVPAAVAWHKANGFFEIGPKEDEGTVEMFTRRSKPVYQYPFTKPVLQPHDYAAIEEMRSQEAQLNLP